MKRNKESTECAECINEHFNHYLNPAGVGNNDDGEGHYAYTVKDIKK